MNVIHFIRHYLEKTYSIPASILFALVMSYIAPHFSHSVAEFGDLYHSFFLLAIFPFLSISIILSMSDLVAMKTSFFNIKKWMIVYISLYCFSSFSGMFISHFMKLGDEIETQAQITDVVRNSKVSQLTEITLNTPLQTESQMGIVTFLAKSVPSNIFNAFSQGTMVQVIVFSILFGIAIGMLPEHNKSYMREFLENVREPFRNFIEAVILCLPIGIFFITSKYLVEMKDPTIIFYLWKFLLTAIVSIIIICLSLIYFVSIKLKISFKNAFAALKKASIIAASTSDSIAAMPSLISGVKNYTRLHKDSVDLVIPIGISLFEFGAVFYYSFLTIFVAQVYDVELDFAAYIMILVATYFAGVAEKTDSHLATLPIIFIPLGLPVAFLTLFMIGVDWLVIPFRALFTIVLNYAGCAMTAQNEEPKSELKH